MGCNFTLDGKGVGALGIFSDPANSAATDGNSPWYLINDNSANGGQGFRFACAAVLAPKILTLKAGEAMELHYQIALSAKAWTADSLKGEQLRWVKAGEVMGGRAAALPHQHAEDHGDKAGEEEKPAEEFFAAVGAGLAAFGAADEEAADGEKAAGEED